MVSLRATARLLACVCLHRSSDATCPLPTYLGTFDHPKAAFLDAVPNPQGGSDLYITSFSGQLFSRGRVDAITNIQEALQNTSATVSRQDAIAALRPTTVDPSVPWPNGVKLVPRAVVVPGTRGTHQVVSCGGFLVPTHGDGSCRVYDLDAASNVLQILVLAQAGAGQFFHGAKFYDVDGDGWKDLVTAKAKRGLWGSGPGKLMWYRNPGTDAHEGPWVPHTLVDGPDVSFELVDLDHDGVPEILSTQFFEKKLVLHYLEAGGSFDDSSAWTARVIEDQVGELFNLTLVDLHGRGHESIVVTNHVTNASLAGVYAYTIPQDIREGTFTRHPLVTGFETLNAGPGQASPGGAVPVATKGHDMLLAVSGDGNQKAYIACRRRKGVFSSRWDWEKTAFLDTGNTVGAIAVSDITGDGHAEIFVPSYEKGQVHVYSYGP